MTNPEMDWQIKKKDLGARFKELFLRNQWTDCAFKVGGEQTEILRGHKLVLAASSPVFEAQFYGSLAETTEVIEVPDLDPETFRLLLKYMYCDIIEVASIDKAGHMLYAARKYMLPHLAQACLDFLLDHTHIRTLWEVLAVAEEMNEEELLASCIKVMCQYPGEMWVNNNEHIGLFTLSKLLEQPAINLLEVELWQLVTAWAKNQCVLKDLSPSATNMRALINQAGLISKVRFLTLTPREFSEFVEASGLLSDEEVRALRPRSIGNSKLISTGNNSPGLDNALVPVGFNTVREMRKRFMSITRRCSRHCLSKKKRYTYGGTIKSTVCVDSRVLVTGFEVFTRIASTSDYMMGHGLVNHYHEDLVMKLSEEGGGIISRTVLNRAVAFFNVTQEIILSEPVWFFPNLVYTVIFELSTGQYPLSHLSSIAYSKSLCFSFGHCEQVQVGSSVVFDVSFINGIMFNI